MALQGKETKGRRTLHQSSPPLGIGTCLNHFLGLGVLPSAVVLVTPTVSTLVRVI
jgi:hypothetical protein